MSDLTILNQDLPDFLQTAGVSELTKQLAGKSGVKRIVPKNGIFRKTVGGEEMGKVKGSLDVIIVNASPAVGRIFYVKQWSPDAEPTAPDCFSNDGRAPDAGSANPQSRALRQLPTEYQKAQAKVTLRLAATRAALRLCWKKTLAQTLKVLFTK